jgi:hypothetical protein
VWLVSSNYIIYSGELYDEELYHYGIKGMRWGVRKDVRVLGNHRRNIMIRQARKDYRDGLIDKSKKQERIYDAKAYPKKLKKDTYKKLASAKNKAEYDRVKYNLGRKTISEVPNSKLKTGAHKVTNILTNTVTGVGLGLGTVGVAGSIALKSAGGLAAMTALPVGAAAVSTAAGTAVVAYGARKVSKYIIDRLS